MSHSRTLTHTHLRTATVCLLALCFLSLLQTIKPDVLLSNGREGSDVNIVMFAIAALMHRVETLADRVTSGQVSIEVSAQRMHAA